MLCVQPYHLSSLMHFAIQCVLFWVVHGCLQVLFVDYGFTLTISDELSSSQNIDGDKSSHYALFFGQSMCYNGTGFNFTFEAQILVTLCLTSQLFFF